MGLPSLHIPGGDCGFLFLISAHLRQVNFIKYNNVYMYYVYLLAISGTDKSPTNCPALIYGGFLFLKIMFDYYPSINTLNTCGCYPCIFLMQWS